MIPQTQYPDFVGEATQGHETSRTHKMLVEEERVAGFTEEIDALSQAIYKLLNTERYRYAIYSHDYGIETEDLYGQPKTLVWPILKLRLKEAVEADDRVVEVVNIIWHRDQSPKETMRITFDVVSIYGDFSMAEEVRI